MLAIAPRTSDSQPVALVSTHLFSGDRRSCGAVSPDGYSPRIPANRAAFIGSRSSGLQYFLHPDTRKDDVAKGHVRPSSYAMQAHGCANADDYPEDEQRGDERSQAHNHFSNPHFYSDLRVDHPALTRHESTTVMGVKRIPELTRLTGNPAPMEIVDYLQPYTYRVNNL
jgi:hypothetical protein